MAQKRWFPLQHELPDGAALGRLMHAGAEWQIFRLKGDGRVLVARRALADRWIASQLLPDTVLEPFTFGNENSRQSPRGPSNGSSPSPKGARRRARTTALRSP